MNAVAGMDPKAIATLRAQAALQGVALYVVDDDHGQVLFVASRWGMTRQMHSVAEVQAFLDRMPGAAR